MSCDDDNIIELLGPKETIGQAVAALMTKHHVGRDEAFEILVQGSSEEHTRVRDVAAAIIKQSRVVDFEMSSQANAIQAVALLRAAGHEDACHAPRGSATREHIISVTTDQAGVEFEVVRLVHAVDPDAQPLGPGLAPAPAVVSTMNMEAAGPSPQSQF